MSALAASGREVPSGPTIAAHQQASPFPDGPVVTVIYRAPCRTEKSELFGAAPHGVEAADVVKSVCRALGVGPGAIEAELDPDARRMTGEQARCYILDATGGRVAHVTGLSFAWINVEASRLSNRGWAPPATDRGAVS